MSAERKTPQLLHFESLKSKFCCPKAAAKPAVLEPTFRLSGFYIPSAVESPPPSNGFKPIRFTAFPHQECAEELLVRPIAGSLSTSADKLARMRKQLEENAKGELPHTVSAHVLPYMLGSCAFLTLNWLL